MRRHVSAIVASVLLLQYGEQGFARAELTFMHEEMLEDNRRCRDALDAHMLTGERLAQVALTHLRACGAVRYQQVISREYASELHGAFLKFESRTDSRLYEHASLRGKRKHYTLPFEAPFNDASIFALGPVDDVLEAYLGSEFVLDQISMVIAPPGDDAQAMHRDVKDLDNVALQIPVQELTEEFGPLALCLGTHNLSDSDWSQIRGVVVKHLPNTTNPAHADVARAYEKALCEDRIIAAPAKAGDVVMYDSKLFHWGGPNKLEHSRYALYMVFKKSSSQPGVHSDFDGTKEAKEATASFQAAFAQTKGSRSRAEL